MKILILKTSAIGDVIQTLPALQYLRHHFPKAQIDWIVEKQSAPLVKNLKLISRVLEIDSKRWKQTLTSAQTWKELFTFLRELRQMKYDLLFDFQGNLKSGLFTACAKAKKKIGFGWKGVKEKGNLLATRIHFSPPAGINARLKYQMLVQHYFQDDTPFFPKEISLNISPSEEEHVNKLARLAGKEIKIMICCGSKWPNKQLLLPIWKNFLQKIVKKYSPFFFFIFGNEKEKECAKELTEQFSPKALLVGNLSLPAWQALMIRVDRVISVDSAALHLCGTTSTPSFGIFGPSVGSSYQPLGKRHAIFEGSCPYGKKIAPRCSFLRTCPTGACLREVNEDLLFHTFCHWMDDENF